MKTEGEFTAYSVGVVYASVCTSLDDEAATARMNVEAPTSTDTPWQIADEAFRTGEPNRVACHDHPETHRHLLFIVPSTDKALRRVEQLWNGPDPVLAAAEPLP